MTLLTRIVRFALIGTICFFVQWCAMHVLQTVMHIIYAGLVAFLLSAQLNFVLSCAFTWRDRKSMDSSLASWTKFNTGTLLGVGINVGILYILVANGFWQWCALAVANAITTIFTFSVNHLIVFRKDSSENSAEPGIFCAGLQRS